MMNLCIIDALDSTFRGQRDSKKHKGRETCISIVFPNQFDFRSLFDVYK